MAEGAPSGTGEAQPVNAGAAPVVHVASEPAPPRAPAPPHVSPPGDGEPGNSKTPSAPEIDGNR